MGRLEAAGFDGDVLDFGTPARRAAVLLRSTADGAKIEAPEGPWTAFDSPVAYQGRNCGCLVLGLDDIELLKTNEPVRPRLKAAVKALGTSRSAPAQGIAKADGVFVWVTQEVDAVELLAMLHDLLFDRLVDALYDDRLDEVNRLAWRLWRASVTIEEKAIAIAALERSQYPEHAQLVTGRPALLSSQERVVFDGVLFHARRGLDWAVHLRGRLRERS